MLGQALVLTPIVERRKKWTSLLGIHYNNHKESFSLITDTQTFRKFILTEFTKILRAQEELEMRDRHQEEGFWPEGAYRPGDHLLYDPRYEHDSCGVGFVAHIHGQKSHQILRWGIEAVINLTHRGAVAADAKTGDGAGVLTQIPEKLFRKEAKRLGFNLAEEDSFAVGMIFLPREDAVARERCITTIEEVLSHYDLPLLGWRPVPVDVSALGDKASATRPDIQQIFVKKPPRLTPEEFERTLYLARKEIERHITRRGVKDFYIPSFSSRTIVYKALVVAPQLPRFYLDLEDPDYETAITVFHQRYSTNTFPTWPLAQPFRFLGHNGEINTLQGNQNWMKAREAELRSEIWGKNIEKLKPVIQPGGSDSAMLDNVFELLVMSGRSPLHAMMMLIPEAYQNMPHMDPQLRAFYEYHACLSEPWDGPAAVAFTDGVIVGATLDRNGLRPARYIITDDDIVLMASEVGVCDIEPSKIVEKGRLGPGKMIAVDTSRGVFLTNDAIKQEFAQRRPYAEWLEKNMIRPSVYNLQSKGWGLPEHNPDLVRLQKAFGYSLEDLTRILEPMARQGKEPVGAMGDDTPLSMLSRKPRSLFTYFKQRFAQVTNPPIDPLREKLVMSLNTALGARGSMLEERPEFCKLIKFNSPVLTNTELEWLRSLEDPAFASITISCLWNVSEGPAGLERALKQVCDQAVRAVGEGFSLIILSDRGVSPEKAPIPILLAVAGVHHALIRQGLRMRASIIAETGEAREDHHFACLIGYGASCVNPYLAFETVAHLAGDAEFDLPERDKALANYKKAIENGILKIMSKMGISTVSSYRGAQIFEAIGLDKEIVDQYFTGTDSRVGGVSLEAIARDILVWHRQAFQDPHPELVEEGIYRYRHGGEDHAFAPEVFKALHKAVRSGQYQDYKEFALRVEERHPICLRDLLEIVPLGPPVPIEEVEPAESIVKRFCTSAMSHGALSWEAHTTLAIAMNRLGAKSNSGEGGEDPSRYHRLPNGDWPNSLIKQVASGRFGVTPEYLASAKELEIKMAQGSKPGEGGQIPGLKVTEEIARIRHAVPGVTLISPPPHHDIYSIEDLAQLIYDLKQANPRAKVAVKLVAEAGVGTVAAGVAKAYADVVHISGHDGGTGASPLGSIKHAGVPWELGLAETQQTLVLNDLRGRVIVRVDGGLKSGRDVIVAALLGAEEYGFGTAALVAAGCVMARQCHSNTCPVGVASQRPDLRKRFPNQPQFVVNYMLFLAQEVREWLARIGARKLDEIIGRVDLLRLKPNLDLPKAPRLLLEALLKDPDPSGHRPKKHVVERNDRPSDSPLDDVILQDASDALQGRGPIRLRYEIKNTHRTVGAKLSGEIAFRYGDKGLPDGTIECYFRGSAGQSFGAFLLRGVRLILEGEANDYVGKGMHGGEIIIFPPKERKYTTYENVIVGNTVMYGATGGYLFAAGRAGERFCVRNSGGTAVVEGVGDHGCEYMTGGVVVVLGETGRNFGAGMTGGVAYVLDDSGEFEKRYNPQLVGIERISSLEDADQLRRLIEMHYERTQSERARDILDNWEECLPLFWKVVPHPSEAQAVPQPSSAEQVQVGQR